MTFKVAYKLLGLSLSWACMDLPLSDTQRLWELNYIAEFLKTENMFGQFTKKA